MRASYAGKNRRINRKRTSSSNQYFNVFLAVVVLILALWTTAGPYGFWKLHKMNEHKRQLYAMVTDAYKENALLKEQIKAFQTDRKFQEEMVRKKLGWVKKNEILYRFIATGSASR